ncbi:MAG: hypothetical protein Q7J86_06380 [Bacteroidota bacterium]|nr:hypothetical protein [Bacteroidota bacterium]MDO9614136.1 hypothetical protein [Bacteroidota bacterium]
MKFSEIVKRNSWLSVELVFLQLYPDQKKSISGYERVFGDLKLLSPMDTDFVIMVSWEKDDFDDEEYAHVCGYKSHPEDNAEDQPNSFAIEFTNWSEWLGMDIDEKSIKDFTELELISHCLYEMTFFGFDQETIQKEMDEIEKEADEIKNMTEEERKTKLKSWDDLKKELDWDDENEE